jgi:RNA polymerase sigma-70 factor (ECF subfamily)
MPVGSILQISQRREFRRLVGNSRERLYRMAYAWTHDPHLADDLVQQAVCKALGNQRQLRDLAAAEAWLFRILANCLNDHRRAKREFTMGDDLPGVHDETPERNFEEQQLVESVRRNVARLPLAQRQVVTLIDLEGFAYATVAQILDIPVGTVMSRLCRGRRALRDLLKVNRLRPGQDRATVLKRVK